MAGCAGLNFFAIGSVVMDPVTPCSICGSQGHQPSKCPDLYNMPVPSGGGGGGDDDDD